jgi:hypothetical protein
VSVALVIQHAMRVRRFILPSVACLAALYLSTLYHKRHGLRLKLLSIKCAFLFSLQVLPEKILIIRIIEQDIINVLRASCKVPLILVRF